MIFKHQLTNGADLKGLITILWSLVTNYILSLSEVITSLVLFFLIFTIIIIVIIIFILLLFSILLIMTIFIPS